VNATFAISSVPHKSDEEMMNAFLSYRAERRNGDQSANDPTQSSLIDENENSF